jgi:hypothetical protein
VSYCRLIQSDFGSDDDTNEISIDNNCVAKEILFKKVNRTRDAMVGDRDNILPINFPVVGTILSI